MQVFCGNLSIYIIHMLHHVSWLTMVCQFCCSGHVISVHTIHAYNTIHTYIHACIHTYIQYIHTYIRNIHQYIYIYIYIRRHPSIHGSIHTYIHACIPPCIHNHTHPYMYTYMYTYFGQCFGTQLKMRNIFSNIVCTIDNDHGMRMMGHLNIIGVAVLAEQIKADVDSLMIFADEGMTDEDHIGWTSVMVKRLN